MDPKIAIIILSHNTKDDTLECLDSVFKIHYPNYEVIVIDNGSEDGSAEAIKARFPQVILMARNQNIGFCAANNMAIDEARSRGAAYIFALNNDTTVNPSVIRELKEALDADSSIGAVSPVLAYYHHPSDFQFTGCDIDWGNGELLSKYTKEGLKKSTVLDSDIAIWAAVLLKIETADIVGYLDERFFLYAEDTDWSVRCRMAGLRTVLYTKPLVLHKGSLSSGGPYSALSYFYYTRNRLIFMRKHASIIRKVQFSFNYVRDAMKNYRRFAAEGKAQEAEALLDGLWLGVTGRLYDDKAMMPKKIRDRLNAIAISYLWYLAIMAVLSPKDRPYPDHGEKLCRNHAQKIEKTMPIPSGALPKVSIIIVNWNRKLETLECLESVSKINYPNYEVIVVDNGSMDDSADLIKKAYGKAVVIRNATNLGFAEGCNIGISYAKNALSKYAMLLNNDTLVEPDAFASIVNVIENDGSIGAAGPLIMYYEDQNKVWSAGGMMDMNRGEWISFDLNGKAGSVYDVDALSGCGLLLRMSAIDRCGVFDNEFFLYGEDIDLCLRMKKNKYRIVCVSAAKIWHKVGKTIGGSESRDYIYYITRNRLLLMKKHGSAGHWFLFLPYFIYTIILKRNMRFIRAKQFNNVTATFDGIRDFLLNRYGQYKAYQKDE